MPLNPMPGMSYEQKEVVFEPKVSALLYSDGLVEAHDPNGEMFGFPGFVLGDESTVMRNDLWGTSS